MPKPTPSQSVKALRRYYLKRHVTIGVIIFAVIVVLRSLNTSGVSRPNFADDDFGRYHDKTFRCVKVVDGDTIDIEIPDLKDQKGRAYTRIRLWGIDTPEVAHHGREAMYFGSEAAEFARRLMQGKDVHLELLEGDTRGYYGRLLAYVYLPDGKMYNHHAIQEGYGYADPRFRHPQMAEFLDAEALARSKLLGLWSGVQSDQLPKWYSAPKLEYFFQNRTGPQMLEAPHLP